MKKHLVPNIYSYSDVVNDHHFTIHLKNIFFISLVRLKILGLCERLLVLCANLKFFVYTSKVVIELNSQSKVKRVYS